MLFGGNIYKRTKAKNYFNGRKKMPQNFNQYLTEQYGSYTQNI